MKEESFISSLRKTSHLFMIVIQIRADLESVECADFEQLAIEKNHSFLKFTKERISRESFAKK